MLWLESVCVRWQLKPMFDKHPTLHQVGRENSPINEFEVRRIGTHKSITELVLQQLHRKARRH